MACSSFATPPAGYQTPSLNSCYWTGWTGWDATWTQPSQGEQYVIAGVNSVHDNGKEDRKFQFKACQVGNVAGTGERQGMTGWQNNWDAGLSIGLSSTYFFANWHSTHDNGKEDRLFAYQSVRFRYTPR